MRVFLLRFVRLIAFVVIAGASTAAAAQSPQRGLPELSADIAPLIPRAEQFLNTLNDVQIAIRQHNPDGNVINGVIDLNRSRRRMRVAYPNDSPILVLARSGTLHIINEELKSGQTYPVSFTPAAFLITDNFNFDDDRFIYRHIMLDEAVTSDKERVNILRIAFTSEEYANRGVLELIFSVRDDGSLVLVQWLVFDGSRQPIVVVVTDYEVMEYDTNDPRFRFIADWYRT